MTDEKCGWLKNELRGCGREKNEKKRMEK